MPQHDVSELLHILFQALEDSTPEFAAIQGLFRGNMVSYIGSPDKGGWRSREEAFMDLQVYMNVCVCVCVYICIYMCVCSCVCVYTNTL